MKNFTFLLIFFAVLGGSINAQTVIPVTGMYTDYNGFWASKKTAINPVYPEDHHNLLGFTWGGTTYSTGVSDATLTSNSVTYNAQKFRGLPIVSIPNTGTGLYVGLGQLIDGVDEGHDPSPTHPISAYPDPKVLAGFLTDGKQGLDIGTGIANIPLAAPLILQLSDNGIKFEAINDGIPDILVSQIANPGNNNVDKIKFTTAGGTTVGNEISLNFYNVSKFPVVGKWMADFYKVDTGEIGSNHTNTERTYIFYAIKLSDFGINGSNYDQAERLVITYGGTSDPAFIAYNEPSIGVASKIGFTSSTVTTDCDGNISDITVQLQDSFSAPVGQAGFIVTATITTGPGDLLGTVTKTTDASGQALFDNLAFEVGGDHKITFSTSSLKAGVTSLISPATNCNISGSLEWDGSTSTDWSDATNWTPETVPNANFDVVIPSGKPNYPVLDVDTGAKDLSMDAGSSIDLNGHLFTIAGQISIPGGTPYIVGNTEGSELYMSGTSLQTIPANFLSGDFDKFTVENSLGVTMNSTLSITGVLNVKQGTLLTNGNITLTCNFVAGVSQGTGQIAELTGDISGNVTAEQCFPARRAFRFVASSVNTATSIRANWQENPANYQDSTPTGYGTHITGVEGDPDGTNGFDYSPSGNPSMFLFNNATSVWSEIDNTDTNLLVAGAPYRLMIRGDRTIDITSNETPPTDTRLRATGTVEKGPVTMNNFNSTNGYFNFFGNPFHAAVNLNKVLLYGRNVNPNFYYMWDPTLGGAPDLNADPLENGGRGAYVTVDLTTGATSIIANAGTTAANLYLQPVQAAFFVTANEGTVPQLIFQESYKNVEMAQTATFKTNSILRNPYIMVNLFTQANYTAGETASDGLKIKFSEIGDNAAEMKDAPKLGNLDENLCRIIDNGYYSLESRNMPANDEVLPLFINQYRFTDYTFLVELNDIAENVTAYLKDYYLDTETELNGNSSTAINFTIDPSIPESIAPDRFAITFNVSDLTITENNVKTFSVYPNPSIDGNFYVSLPNTAGDSVQISLYNILGQEVYKMNGTIGADNRINIQSGRLNAGIYVVKLIHNGKESNQKLIIK